MNFRKVFFVFGALGMLLSSCSKISDVGNLDESAGLPREITAVLDATRTSIDNDWNTAWDENDKMTVYVTRSGHNPYGYSQFTYKGEGKFDGTIDADSGDPWNWFAVYPSFQTSSGKSTKVSAQIEHPAAQTMTGDTKAHIAGVNDPIFGYALGVGEDNNPTIRMHHIASVIDFNVTNGSDKAIKVTKVEFTAPGKIAGKFTADVDLKNGDVQAPAWKADDSAVTTVTLSVSDGDEIEKNGSGHFYAAIHPISAKGDYTIKVTATSEGKTYVSEKTVNAELAFKAGKYKALNYTFVPGEPEPDQKSYVKVTSVPQDWAGTYLIVDESAKKAFDENSDSYASPITISDGKVLWDETVAKCQVTISHSSISGMFDIKTENGKYMYSYNEGATTLNDGKTRDGNTYYNSLYISDGGVTMYSTRDGKSGASVNYFGYATSGNPNNRNFGYKKNATSRIVQLYRLEGDMPEPPMDKIYDKVTTISEGTYLIVNEGSKVAFAFSEDNFKTSVTIEDGQIISSDLDEYEVTVTTSTLGAGKYDVKISDGRYLYKYGSSNDPSFFDTNIQGSNQYYTAFSGNGTFEMNATRGGDGSKNYFYYSSSSGKFSFSTTQSSSHTVQLYKLNEGGDQPEKKSQEIKFSGSEQVKEGAVGTTFQALSLSGAMTAVSYTSSNTAAATVDNSGLITIKGTGVTTITATAAEDATYKSASASYELTVKATSSTEKTYAKVTSEPSSWAGTYLIVRESSSSTNYVFAYDQNNYKTDVTISNSKIVSGDLEKYEVTVSLAGDGETDHYVLKTSDGKFLYYKGSGSFFNDEQGKFYAKISISGGNVTLNTKQSSNDTNTKYYFYYSSSAFGFNKSTGTVQLYKLQDGELSPTPVTASLNIENEKLAAYLDAVEAKPYFSNNNFGSYSSNYTSSLMSSNKYYSGSSAVNRLDQPAPVVITWSGNATKIEVYTSSSRTSGSRVASESFSSSSSASIYNLIPGQKYYYTATNGSTTVATGDFTPTGRRRMIKVSSTFDSEHAANCRDLGGLPTVDGKHVKYGLIYRGTNIDKLTEDNDAKDVFLNTMKIKWDIDLRASSEKGNAPTLEGVSKGSQSFSASFDDGNLKSKTKVSTTLKEIINAINKDTPEPVYIHCRIGSDRTGYICLLVEALIGVTQNYCDTDYEITSFAGNVTGTRFRVDNTMGGGRYKDGINYFADFSGTTLHDKVYNFVTSSSGLNISKTDVDKFISRMTE